MRNFEKSQALKPRLVAIIGTNASGKSALGVHLAKKFKGEIISADSRQVYRGLDIGTGKLPPEERGNIPHHLIDIVDVGENFSLAQYQQLAYDAIDRVLARGRLPILIGGTGLYVHAVVHGYNLPGVPPDPRLRTKLERKSLDELVTMLRGIHPNMAARLDVRNKRRVIRALEIIQNMQYSVAGWSQAKARYRTLQLGLTWPRKTLYKRIDERLARRLGSGMIEEVQRLVQKGISVSVIDKLGLEYRFVLRYLMGQYKTEGELYERLRGAIHAYARRQLTWFKKDHHIIWLDSLGDYFREAEKRVVEFLEDAEGTPAS